MACACVHTQTAWRVCRTKKKKSAMDITKIRQAMKSRSILGSARAPRVTVIRHENRTQSSRESLICMAFSCFPRHSEGTCIVAVMAKLSNQTHSEGRSGKLSPVLGYEGSACGNLGTKHGWITSKCLLPQVCALRRVGVF